MALLVSPHPCPGTQIGSLCAQRRPDLHERAGTSSLVQRMPRKTFQLIHSARSDNGGEVSGSGHLRPLGHACQSIAVKDKASDCVSALDAMRCGKRCTPCGQPTATAIRPAQYRAWASSGTSTTHNRRGAPWSRRIARR